MGTSSTPRSNKSYCEIPSQKNQLSTTRINKGGNIPNGVLITMVVLGVVGLLVAGAGVAGILHSFNALPQALSKVTVITDVTKFLGTFGSGVATGVGAGFVIAGLVSGGVLLKRSCSHKQSKNLSESDFSQIKDDSEEEIVSSGKLDEENSDEVIINEDDEVIIHSDADLEKEPPSPPPNGDHTVYGNVNQTQKNPNSSYLKNRQIVKYQDPFASIRSQQAQMVKNAIMTEQTLYEKRNEEAKEREVPFEKKFESAKKFANKTCVTTSSIFLM